MLKSARDQYRRQQILNALALRGVRNAKTGWQAAAVIAFLQAQSITLALSGAAAALAEQGITAPGAGAVAAESLVTERGILQDLIAATDSPAALDRLAVSLVADAGRTASTVDMGRRVAVTGYVRSLNPPSCGRCAVLAGRVYRRSQGFQRHPLCDCVMTPTVLAEGKSLVTDGRQLALDGGVRGLSKADQWAVDHGADLGKVVNVHRKQAGLTVGSSVYTRGSQLTPQGVLAAASTPEQAIEMLARNGYLR